MQIAGFSLQKYAVKIDLIKSNNLQGFASLIPIKILITHS